MNQVRVIGSHNSFKQSMDAPLLKLLKSFSSNANGLDYQHISLTEQLNLGLRALELDLYHDPEGGRYATPLGLEMVRQLGEEPRPFDTQAMQVPGFKVLHVADIDFRSNQPTLAGALSELREWSQANPNHLPIVVTMNLKTSPAPVPQAVQPLPFDAPALDMLDSALKNGLGTERLLTPDQVRGASESLESAILSRGWPTLDEVRGRFLFAMDEGGSMRQAYLRGHPALRGRVMFTTPRPGVDDAGLLIMNNPVRDEERIRDLVAKGYLVRTRADAETREARAGDTRRFEAALRSGAQIISTDYYLPDPRLGTGYQVRFDDHSYHCLPAESPVSVPSGSVSPEQAVPTNAPTSAPTTGVFP